MELFLGAYSQVFYQASVETVNHLLAHKSFDKGKWNTYLQKTYGMNKRHVNGVIYYSQAKVESAKECRKNHIKVSEGSVQSKAKCFWRGYRCRASEDAIE